MKENYKNLLEAIKKRKPLIMDLGDKVLLHLQWNEQEQIYEDEMGKTTMNLIQEIMKGKVYIKDKQVKIYEEVNNE